MNETAHIPALLVFGLRAESYGEVLLAYLEAKPLIEANNFFGLKEFPKELWPQLNPDRVAGEFDAPVANFNGPQYWLMDAIDTIVQIEPLRRDFGGIKTCGVATPTLSSPPVQTWYYVRRVNRGTCDSSTRSLIVEFHIPEGRTYVVRAFRGDVGRIADQPLAGRLNLLDTANGNQSAFGARRIGPTL